MKLKFSNVHSPETTDESCISFTFFSSSPMTDKKDSQTALLSKTLRVNQKEYAIHSHIFSMGDTCRSFVRRKADALLHQLQITAYHSQKQHLRKDGGWRTILKSVQNHCEQQLPQPSKTNIPNPPTLCHILPSMNNSQASTQKATLQEVWLDQSIEG